MFTIGGTSNRGFYPFEPTGSLRFEDGDSPYLTRTPTTAGNQKTWTFSCWVKRANLGSTQTIFSGGTGSTLSVEIAFGSSDNIQMLDTNNSYLFITSAVFRDPSAWYHIVIENDTTQATVNDRTKLYVNGEQITSFSTDNRSNFSQNEDTAINSTNAHYIGRWINGGQFFDGYMAEIYLVDGTAHDADTFGESKNGVWVPKDAKGSLTFGTNGFYLPFNSTVTAEGQSTVLYEGTGATRSVEGFGYKPDMVWLKNRSDAYHHALVDRVRGASSLISPSQTAAATNYGSQLLAFHSDGLTVGDNGDGGNYVNLSADEYVAWAWDSGADQTPTGFGCVTFTGSGGRRPVRDVGFTPDLLWFKQRDGTSSHALFDSVRGADKGLVSNSTAAQTTSNSGNDLISFDSDGATTGTPQNYGSLGGSGSDIVAWAWDAGDGDPVSNTDGDITSTVKASDTHGFSIGTFTKGSGTQTVGHGLSTAPDWLIVKRYSGGTGSWAVYHSANTANPETDYLRLNSTNGTADDATFWGDTAPTSSVFSVGSAFNSGEELLFYAWTEKSGYSKFGSYTGNGSATGPTVTLGFRPALVAIKRSDSTGNWYFFDTTRDPDNKGQRYLIANSSNAEGGSGTGTEYIDFQSNGFQIIASGSDFGEGNTSGGTYLYMAFAGGLDTIAPVNTDGSIDSRVKASDDTGFSIVRYQGNYASATIGHGLSSAPDWIILKNLSNTADWVVYHSSLDIDGDEYMRLSQTNAVQTSSTVWGSTAATSSVFSTGANGLTNNSGEDYIAYCWTATTGKSAFGSYTGTGASGNSITGLGFEPDFLMIKRTDSTSSWSIHDSARTPNDPRNVSVWAESSSSEGYSTDYNVDFDSDGFTLNTTNAARNASGGTYVYMAFADGKDASFFHDESGQGNSFEPENVQNYSLVPDSPTNNFATLSPLHTVGGVTLSEGNLKLTGAGTDYDRSFATIPITSGKWYAEFKYISGDDRAMFGIIREDTFTTTASHYIGSQSNQYGLDFRARAYTNSVELFDATNFATGDVGSIAFDADNGKVWFGKKGQWFDSSGGFTGDPAGGNNAVYTFTASGYTWLLGCHDYNGTNLQANFGQDDSFGGTVTPGGYTDAEERGSFKYPVPAGFLSLCAANLPEPDISPANGQEPEDYFNTVIYTGASPSDKAVTGVGFQPDWVWIKARGQAYNHALYDSVRGATKELYSNTTDAEATDTNGLKSFDSDGFTVGSDGEVGDPTGTRVAWNWLAGGTAVSNTDGSITSSVSANTKAGFSICKWTGTGSNLTVGHGLEVAPKAYIVKRIDGTSSWHMYHDSLGAGKGIQLSGTGDQITLSTYWNSTAPTSSVFSIGTYSNVNTSSANYIAYVFAEVENYSKIGSYTGNGSSDGVFVHCGFRPAFVLLKKSSAAGDNWSMYDNKRDIDNAVAEYLIPNDAQAAGTTDTMDFVANGFKVRNSGSYVNTSGATYIFIAFAEMPFKYAQAR